MTDNIRQLIKDRTASIRSAPRSELSDTYAAARDLEARNLAERMSRIIGTGNDPDFVLDVVALVTKEATKPGRR